MHNNAKHTKHTKDANTYSIIELAMPIQGATTSMRPPVRELTIELTFALKIDPDW